MDLGGYGFLLVGLGNRLAARFIETPLDREQMRNLQFQRELLERQTRLQERRADEELNRLQIDIEARFKLAETVQQWQAWPLLVHPVNLIKIAIAKQATSVLVVHRPRPDVKDETDRRIEDALTELSSLNWNSRTSRGGQLFYHRGLLKHPYRPTATGHLLVTHLWPSLKSLPFVLMEIDSTGERVRVLGSVWGYDDDGEGRGPDFLPVFNVDLSSVDDAQRDAHLTAELDSYVLAATNILAIARRPVLVDGTASDDENVRDLVCTASDQFPEIFLRFQLGVAEKAPLLGIDNLLTAAKVSVRAQHYGAARAYFEAASGIYSQLRGLDPPEPWHSVPSTQGKPAGDLALLHRFESILRAFPPELVPYVDPPARLSLRDLAKAMRSSAADGSATN